MSTGARRRTTRGLKQTQPADTTEVHMQPQHPPIVEMNDDALKAIWAQHKTAVTEAATYGQEALLHEQATAAKRDSARQLRERIAELTSRAEADEDSAMAEEKLAVRARQDEAHLLDKAQQLANAVHFLGTTNGLVHPAEREKRDAEIAATKAALQNPLNPPPGADQRGSVSSDQTAPFKSSGEQM